MSISHLVGTKPKEMSASVDFLAEVSSVRLASSVLRWFLLLKPQCPASESLLQPWPQGVGVWWPLSGDNQDFLDLRSTEARLCVRISHRFQTVCRKDFTPHRSVDLPNPLSTVSASQPGAY